MFYSTNPAYAANNNVINIPGYKNTVDYNTYWGFPCISQYAFFISNREISFYNETEKEVKERKNADYSCLVAVWRIKSIH